VGTYAIDFITYTDIHHYEYTNGLTEDDVVAVERQVRDEAKARNVDFILFTGDRFVSRNPTDKVKCRADAELRALNELGKPIFELLGNHDRYTKSPFSGHTFHVVQVWMDQLRNVVVMDERKAYRHVFPSGIILELQAIPADHELNAFPFKFEPAHFRLCLFHNIVIGSQVDGGHMATHGITLDVMDLPAFDMVLGGDNHVRQDLPFKNTIGMYTGAPMQHGWGDMGQERGFSHIHLEKDVSGQLLAARTEFIKTNTPKFIKTAVNFKTEEDLLAEIDMSRRDYTNNIVHLTIRGSREDLSKANTMRLQDKIRAATGARLIRVMAEPTMEFQEQIQGMSLIKTPQQDLELLLAAPNYDVGDLDRKKLGQMGKTLLGAVGGR